jgi:hypothetical protein
LEEGSVGTASLAIACLLTVACGSPTAPEAVHESPRWETAKDPLATLEPPALFIRLVVALDSSTAIIGFGIDGTMWSSQAPANGAFSAPRRIDVGAPRLARGPALALAPGGVAVAAWEQPDVDQFRGPMLVWANRLAASTGWGHPSLVERRVTAPEQVDPVIANLAPDVAVASSGEAVVLWAARDVFASVFQDGRTWSEPERLDTRRGPQIPYRKKLRVAAAARGRFLAAWANGPDGRVAWREPASGWGPTVSFRVASELLMDGPFLAADASGRALVAWHALEQDSRGFISRSRGAFATIWSEPAGWGPLHHVSGPDVEAFLIDVALDPVGGGAAFWSKRDDAQLWMSRLSADDAWSPAEVVPGAKALASTAAFLSNGDLLVVWADGPTVFTARRHGPSWSMPETLQDAAPDPQGPWFFGFALAANDRGEALAAWTRVQGPGRGTLWTSRLRVP